GCFKNGEAASRVTAVAAASPVIHSPHFIHRAPNRSPVVGTRCRGSDGEWSRAARHGLSKEEPMKGSAMFETPFHMVGTIVTDPILRRVGDQQVYKFRVASNSRRRTPEGNWEPGNSL